MKKTVRLVIIMVLVITAAITLCGCDRLSEERLAGTWRGTWEYNGNDIISIIDFTENGEYTKYTFNNGINNKNDIGSYDIKGSKVVLTSYSKDQGGAVTTTYKYSDGELVNNGHSLIKTGIND